MHRDDPFKYLIISINTHEVNPNPINRDNDAPIKIPEVWIVTLAETRHWIIWEKMGCKNFIYSINGKMRLWEYGKMRLWESEKWGNARWLRWDSKRQSTLTLFQDKITEFSNSVIQIKHHGVVTETYLKKTIFKVLFVSALQGHAWLNASFAPDFW